MTNQHYLDKDLDSEFLKQGRIDPITGEQIEEGHTIVICAACKSAFFIESWEYLGENHCNQTETLTQIPKAKNLFLEAKPLEYLPFLFKKGNQDVDNTIHSISENAIAAMLVFIGFVGFLSFAIFIGFLTNSPLGGVLALFCMLGLFSFYLNQKKSKTLLKREIKATKATQIALDAKAQGITIKKNTNKQTFKFEDIKELNYFIEYISPTGTDDFNKSALTLQIIYYKDEKKKRTTTTTHYTILHSEEIPKWSDFLEQLPYNLKVLNIQ